MHLTARFRRPREVVKKQKKRAEDGGLLKWNEIAKNKGVDIDAGRHLQMTTYNASPGWKHNNKKNAVKLPSLDVYLLKKLIR